MTVDEISTIRVHNSTKDKLDGEGPRGQSYEQTILELIKDRRRLEAYETGEVRQEKDSED